jgi:hypothetical protein
VQERRLLLPLLHRRLLLRRRLHPRPLQAVAACRK